MLPLSQHSLWLPLGEGHTTFQALILLSDKNHSLEKWERREEAVELFVVKTLSNREIRASKVKSDWAGNYIIYCIHLCGVNDTSLEFMQRISIHIKLK